MIRFFLPNFVSSSLFAFEFTVLVIFAEESHQGQPIEHPFSSMIRQMYHLWKRWWQRFVRNAVLSDAGPPRANGESLPETSSVQSGETEPLLSDSPQHLSHRASGDCSPAGFSKRRIFFVIGTFGLFIFCTAAYISLVKNFFSSARPIGLGMSAEQLGYIFSGPVVACIAIQAFGFTKIESVFGCRCCYSASLLVVCAACWLTPLLGKLVAERIVLWAGVVGMLTLKIAADFMAISSSLLLVSPVYLVSDPRSHILHPQSPDWAL